MDERRGTGTNGAEPFRLALEREAGGVQDCA